MVTGYQFISYAATMDPSSHELFIHYITKLMSNPHIKSWSKALIDQGNQRGSNSKMGGLPLHRFYQTPFFIRIEQCRMLRAIDR